MKVNLSLHLGFGQNATSMTVRDETSNAIIARIPMSHEQLGAMLSGVKIETTSDYFENNAYKIGKTHEMQQFEFIVPEGMNTYSDREQITNHCQSLLDESVLKGWKTDHIGGSRNSFFNKDGEQWARATVRRWV